ncbi:hypothetical protein BS47DRAFT_1368657 [Hydnum rufescens UP504]|uniref:Uncharacterized protein n=1 Tax=Hydnum rufescens UP504 TaxID=1448309 RepID=A0A9P6AEX1_9AGAM|nr:hypothetical protein BS47DRAFT_1368657 [Hydnum rufescens UP504]
MNESPQVSRTEFGIFIPGSMESSSHGLFLSSSTNSSAFRFLPAPAGLFVGPNLIDPGSHIIKVCLQKLDCPWREYLWVPGTCLTSNLFSDSAGVVGGPDTGRREFDGPTVDMVATRPDRIEHIIGSCWEDGVIAGSEGDGLKVKAFERGRIYSSKDMKGLKEDQIETKWKMNVLAWDLAAACKMPDIDMEISKDIPGVEGIEEEHPRLCKGVSGSGTRHSSGGFYSRSSTASSKFSGKVMGPLTSIGPVNIAFRPNWDECHCGIVAMTLGTQQEGAQHRQAAISELVWSENTEQDEHPMQAGHDQRVGLE